MHWVFSSFGKHPIPGSRGSGGARPPPPVPAVGSLENTARRHAAADGQPDTVIPSPQRHSQRENDFNSQRASAGSSTLNTRPSRAQTAESVHSFGHNLHALDQVAAPAPANFYTRDALQGPRRSQSFDIGAIGGDGEARTPHPSWPLPDSMLTPSPSASASVSPSLASTSNMATTTAGPSNPSNVGHRRSISNSGRRRSNSVRMRSSHELARGSSERMRGSSERMRGSHEHMRSGSRQEYTLPTNYENLDEVAASPPASPRDQPAFGVPSLQRSRSQPFAYQRTASHEPSPPPRPEYSAPIDFANLNEVTDALPVENPNEGHIYRHTSLEQENRSSPSLVQERKSSRKAPTMTSSSNNLRDVNPEKHKAKAEPSRSQQVRKSQQAFLSPRDVATPGPGSRSRESEVTALPRFLYNQSNLEEQLEAARMMQDASPSLSAQSDRKKAASRIVTELYAISYLIFFSIWGTLARLGLQWLTFYPGAPVVISVLWPNFAGSLVLGFLAEDRRIFRQEWGSYKPESPSFEPSAQSQSQSLNDKFNFHNRRGHRDEDLPSQVVSHSKVKKTIPLYIGIATGFCGSFTSFSSFMRDVFLSMSNNLPTPVNHPYPAGLVIPDTSTTIHRNGGYSFMAVVAVLLLTLSLSLAGLKIGAHIAILLDPWLPTLNFHITRRFFDPLFAILAWGCWLGAVFMSIWPPDRPGGPNSKGSWASETWRGQAIFACVFAPVGCLIRFYASLHLNGLSVSFPLGTFAVNIFGTAVEGMAYDLQHVGLGHNAIGGGVVSCQILQGIMDGFCGCLTTVSTWVAELNSLKRHHSYLYGTASVVGGVSLMVAIMGSVRWSVGWSDPVCVT